MQHVASSWSVHEERFQVQTTPLKMEAARKHIVDYVLHSKSPIVIDSFQKSDYYDPQQATQIGSVLCVPISSKVLEGVTPVFLSYVRDTFAGQYTWNTAPQESCKKTV